MSEQATPVLGETAGTIAFADSVALAALSLELARQCRRQLDIVSRHLDPAVYDSDDFAEAVKVLALSHRQARIRLFVVDSRPLVSRGHRLLTLAERLSSYVEIRVPSPQHKDFNEAMLVADGRGYTHRRLADRFDGVADFNAPRLAAALVERIDELWERGRPDANFRRLHL